MGNKFNTLFKSHFLAPFLLSFFFVLHGVEENYDFVPLKDALVLLVTYCIATLISIACFTLFFKNVTKACLISFLLMAIHFFFGSLYDTIKKTWPHSFLTKYSFLIPLLAFLFISIVIVVKKRKPPSKKMFIYFNVLLVIILFIDSSLLVYKYFSLKKENDLLLKQFTPYNYSPKPDLYFIVMDEYAGQKELSDLLNFDNSSFENDLIKRGFHIIGKSRSNYISTPLSVASFFNMNYLDFTGIDQEQDRVLFSYNKIRHSPFLSYLLSEKYIFYNYSIFSFYNHRSPVRPTFLPTAKDLISSQTFISRLQKDLGYHLFTTLGLKQNPEEYIYIDQQNNDSIYKETYRIASLKTGQGKFIYSHLMMPHYPYYFTKNGEARPLNELAVVNKTNPDFYLEYLGYCNKKILALTDEIQKKSPGAMIILTGDHGFRAFEKKVDESYFFNNFCAVYLPSNNYSNFYDSLTPVNLFRVLLNTQFGQKLTLVKDSSVILHKTY